MEMNPTQMLNRLPQANELALEAQRPETPVAAPTAARQAETAPGVDVQISTAAREAAARDPVATTEDVTDPQATSAAVSSARTGSDATAANVTTSSQAEDGQARPAPTQSASAQQALQLFAETAGIGLEQANASPLRAVA
ncbi:MAG: hypothetical protein ACK4KV_07075 [Rhodocyclaceae bacterium]